MSRIDEALQRATPGVRSMGPIAGGHEDPFVSPWDESAEPEASDPRDSIHLASGIQRPTLEAAAPREAVADREPLLVPVSSTALPALNTAWGERLASAPSCHPALVEQFRRLAATLHNAQAASSLRVVMVTSAAPGDGKTLTAINLALVLSESYKRRVLLIDADLRRPSIGNIADLTGTSGLSEALKAKQEQKLAVIPLTENLTLLPAGVPDPDPVGGLTSSRMRRIIDEASARFDWVIVDAPPVGPIADASLLAQMVDGTLFVLRAGHTPHPLVQKALDTLGRDRVLGIVLNGVDPEMVKGYGAYYMSARPTEA